MQRFVITILVATLVHAIFLIVAPPYEFGHTRLQCFISAFISGITGFPVLGALILLPSRALVRRLMPQQSQKTQTVVVASVVLSGIAIWYFILVKRDWTPPPHMHGLIGHCTFMFVFSLSVITCFFWPFGQDARRVEARSGHV